MGVDIPVCSISFLTTPAPSCPLGQNVPQPSYHHDAQPVLQPQVRERHRKGALIKKWGYPVEEHNININIMILTIIMIIMIKGAISDQEVGLPCRGALDHHRGWLHSGTSPDPTW